MAEQGAVHREYKNAPIQVTMCIVNGIVAVGSLYVAWKTSGGTFQAPAKVSNASVDAAPYLIAMAAFIGTSTATALICVLLRHISWIASFFMSIVLAILTVFLVALVVRSQGIIIGTAGWTASLVIAGVILVFAAFSGDHLITDVHRRSMRVAKPGYNADDLKADVAISVVAVAFAWLLIVAAGSAPIASAIIS